MAPIELFLGRMLLWNNCLKTFEELLIYFTFFMKPRGVKNLDGLDLLGRADYQLSSPMPNLSAFEFGQSSCSLKTAPSPVVVLPILVLPSVLKLPI